MSYFNSNPDGAIALFLFAISMILVFAFLPNDEEKLSAEKRHEVGCNTKYDRGRPACWKEVDWKIYCQRVSCKR